MSLVIKVGLFQVIWGDSVSLMHATAHIREFDWCTFPLQQYTAVDFAITKGRARRHRKVGSLNDQHRGGECCGNVNPNGRHPTDVKDKSSASF